MAILDHIVVNAKFDIDAAAACFGKLGFALTARGQHSLGSVNHLIMFHDHYLEIVGLSRGTTTLRREILESPRGIDGLVFKTDDAAVTSTRLRDLGFQVGEPQSFTRRVTIDNHEETAEFRATRLVPGEMAAGRIYFCEHVTPQWVFRPEWTLHPNGAQALVELIIVSAEPAATEAQYRKLTAGTIDGCALVFNTRAEYEKRYAESFSETNTRDEYFGAVVVAVRDLAKLRDQFATLKVSSAEAAALGMIISDSKYRATGTPSLVVSLTQIDVVIEFVDADHQ